MWRMHLHLSRAAAQAALILTMGLAAIAPPAFSADENPWKPEGTSDGIAIFTRQLPGQPLRDFRGTMQIDAPLAQVAATLADVQTMHEWFYLLDEARFVRGAYTQDSHMYMAIKGIWPVSPRDMVARVLVRQDPITHAVHIDAQSEDNILPPQPGYVRIPEMRSSWTLRPVSANKTEVQIEGHGPAIGGFACRDNACRTAVAKNNRITGNRLDGCRHNQTEHKFPLAYQLFSHDNTITVTQ
jgi:hypothetical protein